MRSLRSMSKSRVVITVFLSSVTAFSAFPRQSMVIRSISSPSSSLITVAPVKNARSCTVSCLVGPKPGKSMILTLILPFTLFIIRADFSCCSTSATISNSFLFFITCSSIGCILRTLGILLPTIKTSGSSSTQRCLSVSVIKCGDVIPQSNCTPSTTSTYVFSVSDSSIKTTPSLPTLVYASEIILPKTRSLLQLILLTSSSMSSFTSIALSCKCLFTLSKAVPTPSLIVLIDKSLYMSLFTSFISDSARTVAVVVPSPASFTVFLAASLIKVAPRFSTGSYKTTDSATVTPSFVMTGLPLASSYITHLPEAPRVDLTAFANLSTPVMILFLALSPKFNSLINKLG